MRPMDLSNSHAAIRAAERHGLSVTTSDLRSAFLDIVDTVAGLRRAAVLLHRKSNGTERWLVRLGERAVRVVYIPEAALIVTVLPNHNSLVLSSRTQDTFGRTRGVRKRGEAERLALREEWT